MTNSQENSDYQSFLNAKAEKYKTPQALINQVVEQAIHERPAIINRLIHGEVNEVYKIETEHGQSLVLRIAHATGERAAKERWAIEKSAAAGVPVPDILNLTTLETEDGPRTFCLQKEIEGVPLSEMKDVDQETKKSIIIEAGSMLKKIHSIPTRGFGWIDGQGVGMYSTIQQSLTEHSGNEERLAQIAKSAGIDNTDIQRSLSILEDVAKDYDYTDSRLLHMDFSPKHFMIKDGRINGIIDFENAKGGDPIEELARWHYYFKDKYPMEWLLEGYGETQTKRVYYEKLMHAWRFNFGLGVLDYYENDKNQHGVRLAKRELTEDLMYFI